MRLQKKTISNIIFLFPSNHTTATYDNRQDGTEGEYHHIQPQKPAMLTSRFPGNAPPPAEEIPHQKTR